MTVDEALEKLSGFYDLVASTGFCTDEELAEISEAEEVLYRRIKTGAPLYTICVEGPGGRAEFTTIAHTYDKELIQEVMMDLVFEHAYISAMTELQRGGNLEWAKRIYETALRHPVYFYITTNNFIN